MPILPILCVKTPNSCIIILTLVTMDLNICESLFAVLLLHNGQIGIVLFLTYGSIFFFGDEFLFLFFLFIE